MRRKEERFYQGVEGDNWYLYNDEDLYRFLRENLDRGDWDEDYVGVCIDMEFIYKYINISKIRNIDYRVLACVTDKPFPQMELPSGIEMRFIGYDYAYAGGWYYSAIYEDVDSKRIPEFADIEL